MKIITSLRPFEILSWLLFIPALIFKFSHWPGANEMLILSGIAVFLYYAINLRRGKKDKNEVLKSLIGLTSAFWIFYVIFRILFWQGTIFYFAIAFFLSISAFIFTIVLKRIYLLQTLYAFIFLLVSLYIDLIISTSQFYYYVKFPFTNEIQADEISPVVWSRYSWLLYQEGEYDKAIEAINNSKRSLDFQRSFIYNELDSLAYLQIDSNRKMIEARTWDQYIPFE